MTKTKTSPGQVSATAACLLLALTATACGALAPKSKSDAGKGAGGSPGTETPAPTGTATTADTDTDAGDTNIDQEVGIKTGEQMIAHFALTTGVKYEDFDQATKDFILNQKQSLPIDNSPEKVTPKALSAAANIAALFCDRFFTVEEQAQTNPNSTVKPRMIELSWSDGKLTKAFAKPIYDELIRMFWGEDSANLPEKTEVYKVLDELVDAGNQAVTSSTNTQIPALTLRAQVRYLCVPVAVAWPALEI